MTLQLGGAEPTRPRSDRRLSRRLLTQRVRNRCWQLMPCGQFYEATAPRLAILNAASPVETNSPPLGYMVKPLFAAFPQGSVVVAASVANRPGHFPLDVAGGDVVAFIVRLFAFGQTKFDLDPTLLKV